VALVAWLARSLAAKFNPHRSARVTRDERDAAGLPGHHKENNMKKRQRHALIVTLTAAAIGLASAADACVTMRSLTHSRLRRRRSCRTG
jgi:hypothetical protein